MKAGGLCVWLTGLSGAGKTTIAGILVDLLTRQHHTVTLLDGDIVRTHLSQGLGFSRTDRDMNVRRIAFVAGEVVRHGGIAICATVSPYRTTRAECRRLIGEDHFVEVFIDAALDVCEARDSKGLYAKVRKGEIRGFTGIDDPYEAPEAPEVHLDSNNCSAENNARALMDYLRGRGFIGTSGSSV
jgi:sulfate adenylyltransferase